MTNIIIGGIKVEHEVISTKDFLNISDHLIWCSETRYDKRIDKAKGEHLRGAFSPTMASVAIAIHRDGTEEKLDGHSRSRALMEDKLKYPPEHLILTKYFVNSQKESDDLFKQFDSALAGDTSMDRLNYAYNQQGMDIHTPFLKAAATQAIKTASGISDIYLAVSVMKKGINLVDGLKINKREVADSGSLFCSGALAAMIKFANEYSYETMAIMNRYYTTSDDTFADTRDFLISKEADNAGGAWVNTSFNRVYRDLCRQLSIG